MDLPPDLNSHAALTRFQSYGKLSEDELTAMLKLAGGARTFARHSTIQKEGEPSTGVVLLLRGWTASSMMFDDGKRHIVKVHLAGDLIGLPGLPVTTVPDTVTALTDVTVAHISLPALGAIFHDSPRIAAMLFMISQEERLMLMDRLALVGRRSTAGRFAGIVLQIESRMQRQSPGIGDTLEWPLSQADLADMIGVSNVHISRTVSDLRDRRILDWQRNRIIIHDRPALRRMAGLPAREISRDQAWLPGAADRP